MPIGGQRFRYSTWDGSQADRFPTADELMSELSEDLLQSGDLRSALNNLMQRGFRMQGEPMQGLRDMLRQVRRQRRERLERFDLGSIMEGLREELEAIVELERATLDAMSGDSADGAGRDSFAQSLMGDMAGGKRDVLDDLPEDPAAQMRALSDYEFVDPEAQKRYQQLVDELKQAMTRSFFRDVEKMVREMSDGDIQRMKDMVRDLNAMLVKRIAGEDPDFEGFMAKYGDMFGDDPPRSLDELIEQIQAQMAAMQSLMMSLPTSQYEQLQKLLSDRLGDAELDAALRKLMQKLDFLDPGKGQRYRFSGDEPIDLESAMDLMGEMQGFDELEGQLQAAQMDGDLTHVDLDQLRETLGEEAVDALEQMQKLLEVLEQAGFIDRNSEGFELTPRGMRMIGQKALGEIFKALRRQSLGNHALPEQGRFGDRVEDTKVHEYGDPFNLHMARTLQNALRRQGPGTPVQLAPEDFEIYRNETVTCTVTVMLVDLSWSMELRGAFPAAKKVAMALNNLITSAYPRDSFHVVGFSAYAKELASHEVPFLTVDEYVLGTNIQHALLIAERLLAREQGGSKQILMITDGEPTAHIEQGRAQFAYPPTPQTIRETLKAVKRCTRSNITINTFMLDESYYLKAFMDQVSQINGGRVFYSSPEKLGEYVLVDYVQHKRKVLGGR
jgi:uncharacterized protein with von Willebrand factor type A (vWA) domain